MEMAMAMAMATRLSSSSSHFVVSKTLLMLLRFPTVFFLALCPSLALSPPFRMCKAPELCDNPSGDHPFGDSAPMLLLKNGFLYTPSPVGRCHVLLAGGAVVSIFKDDFPLENLTGLPLKTIDVKGSYVVPGLVDMHCHLTGGGGEMGPASRTPEGTIEALVEAGITTVVGILGTDCVSRSLENLRVKVAALREEGITTFMWSGCYRVPSPTLTGSLVRDMQLIEEVVGAGEIAISDHRSSWPTTQELLSLVTDARVGGMLSGKAGVVHFHTGSADSLLQPLWDVVKASRGAIPMTHMLPTHVAQRGPALLKAAEVWVSEGGRVDFTSDQENESQTFDALINWGKRFGNSCLKSVSISSDAFGSLPKYNTKGELVEYAIAAPKANLNTIRNLVHRGGWALEDALQLSTTNPATFLSFKNKGKLEVGADADVVVLHPGSLEVQYVIANGKLLKSPEIPSATDALETTRCSDRTMSSAREASTTEDSAKELPTHTVPLLLQNHEIEEAFKDWYEKPCEAVPLSDAAFL